MTAAEVGSFALVVLGWLAFRAIYRHAQSRDRFHVSAEYVKEMARKEANEAADVR